MKSERPTANVVALLLWVGLLLSGQTLALAHQHADDAPETPCAVCPVAKAETAACDDGPEAVPPLPLRWLAGPYPDVDCPSSPARHFRPRGPPRA